MHVRAAALDSHFVGQVAEGDEVVTLARVENNPDRDASGTERALDLPVEPGNDHRAATQR